METLTEICFWTGAITLSLGAVLLSMAVIILLLIGIKHVSISFWIARLYRSKPVSYFDNWFFRFFQKVNFATRLIFIGIPDREVLKSGHVVWDSKWIKEPSQ